MGHTKNACNHLFNSLKHEYQKRNTFTMDKLIDALSVSWKISIIWTKHDNFLDYNVLFKVVYNDLKGLVTKNHIFTCSHDNDDDLWMSIRESNLEDCNETKYLATKQCQRSRTNLEAHMNWLP